MSVSLAVLGDKREKLLRKFLGVMDVFPILMVVMGSHRYAYVRILQMVQFSYGHLTVCKLYFNKAVSKALLKVNICPTQTGLIVTECFY